MPDDAPTHFYARYMSRVPEADVVAALESQFADTLALLAAVTPEQAGTLHPPYTWTFRQVVGHVIDAERVFAYRALRIARSDDSPRSGYDETLFAAHDGADGRTLPDLLDEFALLRKSNVAMFRHLPAAAWDRTGAVNGVPLSVRDLARTIVGHERHHVAIIRQRLSG